MKVGINLYTLYPGKIGGAEQYVRNVIREMHQMEGVETYIFLNSVALPTFEAFDDQVLCHIDEQQDRDTQMQFYIDYYKIEVLFCPLFFIAPSTLTVPAVASILDVQHEFFPEYFDKKTLKEIRKNTAETLALADGVLTISEYSKQTIIDKCGIPADKIQVTYLNSDGVFDKPILDDKKAQMKERLGADYIFFPANTWPHKNHINLLRAYKILKDEYHTKLKLVFTGDSKQQKAEIEDYIIDNHLEEDVMYLGYIAQEEMPYVFANATILAFPSVFEGFGIPLVEAMKAGVAIACSECGSIPEVAMDAALYFDALNPADIALKLHQLEADPNKRQELIEKGKRVAPRYSWKKCAEDTIAYLSTFVGTVKVEKECNEYEDMPLVTVVTPSYNQGEFIKATIDSVLGQDYPNIEYLVMDGGSTDNTVEILKSYGDKITWVSEKDKGQADAVNKGILRAHGTIIGWLNSDDTYLDGTISKIVDYLKSHPDTDMVYGEGYYTDKDGNVTERYLTEKFSRKRLGEQCIICQPTAFFTKAIVEKAGMLDPDHHLSMDYELWMRISKVGKVAYVPDYLATSRMYEENKTMSRRTEVYEETIRAVKKHYGYAPITWINGYADYLCEGDHGDIYNKTNKKLFIKYNLSNPKYLFDNYGKIFGSIFGRIKNKIKSYFGPKDDGYTGKYPDGWMSRVYREELREAGKITRIVINGTHAWPLKDDLIITAYLGGKLLGKQKITTLGDFQVEFPVANNHFQNRAELELRMNKYFCPSAISNSADTRELSFITRELIVERSETNE